MTGPQSFSPRRAPGWLAILALLLAGAVFAGWLGQRAAAGRGEAAPAASASQRSPEAGASARLLRIRVRDSVDGGALDADVSVHPLDVGGRAAAPAADPAVRGARSVALAAGEYELRIGAAGHRRLSTRVRIDAAQPLPLTVWLAPAVDSDALDRLALKAAACARCALFGGRVFDAASGAPLTDAVVRSSQGGRTRSDRDGYFELPAQLPARTDTDAVPDTIDLIVEAPGYRGREFAGLPLLNDARALIVDLDPGQAAGQGLIRSDRRHVQQRARARADRQRPMSAADAARSRADADTAAAASSFDRARPASVARAQRLSARSANVPVPASIRVGTQCSGRSCAAVSVYAFEDYVGRGLDEEWIASWSPQSLAAGAVAYRSYAAYYVAHPINGRYDICASTSCQAFDGDSVAATVAAAAATRGVVLTRDGASAAFSEYSSENNAWDDPGDGLSCVNTDLSCGNGRNGSPRNGWPCLSDEVGRGRGCFGHGRGMSQWGTQRWAASHGRDWRWIANHYFNGNNAPGGQRNAYLANDGAGPGPGAVVFEDFETGVGRFDSAPTYSGSTTGVSAASLTQRDCATRRNGACSLRVLLKDDPGVAAPWAVRLLSGGGTPANNLALIRAGGKVGLWVYTGGSGLRVALSIDDSDGTERSVERALAANQWTYLEWTLDDDNQWNAWAGAGNGRIDAASVRLDAVWLLREQTSFDVNLYLDDVQIAH